MWHWDQGRLEYYQFDSLRKIAGFVIRQDVRSATRSELLAATGLPFSAPETHSPWRNYSRVLKLALLVYEAENKALPTPIATILATPGVVTADEYFHFLARAFTEPSPALKDWSNKQLRYPLLFTLKYLLAKASVGLVSGTTLDEIIGAFGSSGFDGTESDTDYISLINDDTSNFESYSLSVLATLRRQARESILVISQISYLTISGKYVFVSLHQQDAIDVFQGLFAISGPCAFNGNSEILRIARLFESEFNEFEYDYQNTTLCDTEESGFLEGDKVRKTHIVIERNAELRRKFFEHNSTTICDFCGINTQRAYPWADNVIDLHHLLPLASGTRVIATGTAFDDIRAICPTCHRAVHKYYSSWLSNNTKKDFEDKKEALGVYQEAKNNFRKIYEI